MPSPNDTELTVGAIRADLHGLVTALRKHRDDLPAHHPDKGPMRKLMACLDEASLHMGSAHTFTLHWIEEHQKHG